MSTIPRLRELLERFVEHHVRTGERLSAESLCGDHHDLVGPLNERIDRYLGLDRTLEGGLWAPAAPAAGGSHECAQCGSTLPAGASPGGFCPRCLMALGVEGQESLPTFDGFETIERLGGGGMGEVYKLRDRRLDRVVAGKVIRRDGGVPTTVADFLREAQSLALFQDERIVRVFEFRPESDPPVILMEYVDGFQLGQVGPSLEFSQRARILVEVCEAIERAHTLGIQHRDLKPANIMLDASLKPKILDFGLSEGSPDRGHLRGTPHYLAPEQLDPRREIDARADVYALGVILYELLCNELPYSGRTLDELLEQVRQGQPRLPVELVPLVPEPLQAIALRAMETDPEARYPSAREMALDLRRWLDGRPVLARPTYYSSALGKRLQPHLEQVDEWLRLKLIYPHEAGHLRSAYRRLEARDDDWIVESRVLSWSQIVLYLGGFLLLLGSLLYFGAHRIFEAVEGILRPLAVLGIPFLGLNAVAHLLYRREHKAVAVAFVLTGVLVLPLFLLIVLDEGGLLTGGLESPDQLFPPEFQTTNRQLQVSILAACGWAFFLAWRTRTAALSTVFTVLLFLLGLSVLSDVGLRSWVEEGEFDLLALHLLPLVLLMGWLGFRLEAGDRSWFGRPLYVGSAVLYMIVLELLALEGQAFEHLGLTLAPLAGPEADPVLLDTLVAMSLNGIAIYALGWALERHGTEMMRTASYLLFVLSPFAILQPLGFLVKTGEYSLNFDWIYLALALLIILLSRHRQRRSFYFAGLLNIGIALWVITDHNEWFDLPGWAMFVIGVGMAVLAIGYGLDRHERTSRRIGGA